MVRALAEANLLVNLDKSHFLGSSDVEVLGHIWSAHRAWVVPGGRVSGLEGLEMPTTPSAIRRMCGGINAVSAHLPWSQAALLPFYEKSVKQRLSKQDVQELQPHWQHV